MSKKRIRIKLKQKNRNPEEHLPAEKATGTGKLVFKSCDFPLLLMTAVLILFGIIMVFSASYYTSINASGDPYSYLKKDIAWMIGGTVLLAFTALIHYRVWKRLAVPMLVTSIVLLLLLFTPLGVEINYATRWLGVEVSGHSLTIMPGEIAKICAIVFVAWYLSKEPKVIKSFTRGILPLFALCLVYAVLIIKQPNLSTAITICGIIIGVMFVAGMHWGYLVGMVTLAAAGVMSLIFAFPDSHWNERLTSFLDPFADPLNTGYQVVQSLYALGSGGLFGLGLGKSIQKNLYLPEPQNDFILSIIGEELGYVGCIVLMIVYLLLIWRCTHIALNAPDYFGTLLASGITIMITLQVILNVAVVTSSMPATGVTLPFISYGGNALLLFMGSIGIMLNISRHIKP